MIEQNNSRLEGTNGETGKKISGAALIKKVLTGAPQTDYLREKIGTMERLFHALHRNDKDSPLTSEIDRRDGVPFVQRMRDVVLGYTAGFADDIDRKLMREEREALDQWTREKYDVFIEDLSYLFPFEGLESVDRVRARIYWISSVEAVINTTNAYAIDPQTVDPDGKRGYGPYAKALSEYVQDRFAPDHHRRYLNQIESVLKTKGKEETKLIDDKTYQLWIQEATTAQDIAVQKVKATSLPLRYSQRFLRFMGRWTSPSHIDAKVKRVAADILAGDRD